MYKNGSIKRLLVYVLMFIFIVPVAVGCSNQTEKTTKEGQIDTYVASDGAGDCGFPSPYGHHAYGTGYLRMSFIFDTLVWKDDKDIIPALAESWEYLKDENAYLFKLHKDVTWHDGTAFSAKDVVFTFNYTKSYPYQYVDNKIVSKAEAVDEHTVKLYLDKPFASFLTFVAGVQPILPEHIWKNVSSPDKYQEKDASIGTGPYKLVDYNKEQGSYLFESNDKYYQGKPKVKQLKFVKISKEMAAAALQQKQVDFATVPPETEKDLASKGFEVLVDTGTIVRQLMINHQKEPFSNTEFRQALSYAIDRQAIVDTAQRGYATVGSPGLVPPNNPWYNANLPQYSCDPDKSREILSKLGYIKKDNFFEKDGKTLTLNLLYTPESERNAEMVKKQLENAGIKINLRSLESAMLASTIVNWDFDLAVHGSGGLCADPTFFQRAVVSDAPWSARYFKNKSIIDLFDQQAQEMDKTKRKNLVGQIQELYAQDVPSIPLYYQNTYYVHNNKLNLYFTIEGMFIGCPIPLNKMSFIK
ncbi:MAG: ABC transporter substrate-binding protein [Fastidiosipilaceae bacterium]|jgi:peptide/nickel transport system substrate-binding protein